MSKINELTTSPAKYKAIIDQCFQEHYQSNKDFWTRETAMATASDLLHAELAHIPGRHILDIGAGSGRDALKFLQAGYRVTAVDLVTHPAWPAIRERWGARVDFVAAPFLEAPLTGPFQVIQDNGCFHHQHPASYAAYLARIRELLIDEGLLFLNVFAPEEGEAEGSLQQLEDGRVSRVFTAEEISTLLDSHGFTVLRTQVIRRQLAGMFYLAVWAQARPGRPVKSGQAR